MEKDLDIKEIEEIAVPETKLSAEDTLLFQDMAEMGIFYGMAKGKTNPKMKPYIHSTRSGVEIINLEKTIESLKKAAEFLKSVQEANKAVLIVGTTPISKAVVKDFAEQNKLPYVVNRWLGGSLTNFKVITTRINRFKKLTEDKESGELTKYTKKERVVMDREMAKMNLMFGGIKDMEQLPGALFVLSLGGQETAVLEAKIMNIPVVALVNTNMNPNDVEYPIPANDRTSKSVSWILNYLQPYLLKNEHREHREA